MFRETDVQYGDARTQDDVRRGIRTADRCVHELALTMLAGQMKEVVVDGDSVTINGLSAQEYFAHSLGYNLAGSVEGSAAAKHFEEQLIKCGFGEPDFLDKLKEIDKKFTAWEKRDDRHLETNLFSELTEIGEDGQSVHYETVPGTSRAQLTRELTYWVLAQSTELTSVD